MASFTGSVSGIDVIATADEGVRCLAIITQGELEIQFEVHAHELQTALELACILKVGVEVSYAEGGPAKRLSRVRILDR